MPLYVVDVSDIVDIAQKSAAEILDIIKDDPGVIAAEFALAQEAAEYAKSISPVETGEYRDNINPHQEGNEVWVGFDSDIANLIEYGSINNAEYAIGAKTEEHFNNEETSGRDLSEIAGRVLARQHTDVGIVHRGPTGSVLHRVTGRATEGGRGR